MDILNNLFKNCALGEVLNGSPYERDLILLQTNRSYYNLTTLMAFVHCELHDKIFNLIFVYPSNFRNIN